MCFIKSLLYDKLKIKCFQRNCILIVVNYRTYANFQYSLYPLNCIKPFLYFYSNRPAVDHANVICFSSPVRGLSFRTLCADLLSTVHPLLVFSPQRTSRFLLFFLYVFLSTQSIKEIPSFNHFLLELFGVCLLYTSRCV